MTTRATGGEGPEFGPFLQVSEIIRKCRGFPIPCGGDDGKEPLVRWRHFTSLPSRAVLSGWRTRFGGANAGILTGPSRLTVVDVDDADLFPDALAEHGETPLIVCTPRGGFHLYYRSAGEATVTRKDGAAIDVRGIGGFVVVPPSRRPSGQEYRFHAGSWADLERLPTAHPGSLPFAQAPAKVQTIRPGSTVSEGSRNDTLFRELLRVAAQCETEAELEFRAAGFNEAICHPPLPDREVRATVRSVWRYKTDGRIWTGTEARAVFTRSEVMSLADESDAIVLLAVLRIEHGGRASDEAFSVSPKGLVGHEMLPGWGDKRIRKGRDFLLQINAIARIHEGGNGAGDPDLYRFPKGPESAPNITYNIPPLIMERRTLVQAQLCAMPSDEAAPLLFAPSDLPHRPTPAEALRQQVRGWCREGGRGSQSRLAETLGLSRHTVANWLAGRYPLNDTAEATLRRIVGGEP